MARLEDRVDPAELLSAIRGGAVKSELIREYRTTDEELAMMLLPEYRRGELTKEEFNNFFKGLPIKRADGKPRKGEEETEPPSIIRRALAEEPTPTPADKSRPEPKSAAAPKRPEEPPAPPKRPAPPEGKPPMEEVPGEIIAPGNAPPGPASVSRPRQREGAEPGPQSVSGPRSPGAGVSGQHPVAKPKPPGPGESGQHSVVRPRQGDLADSGPPSSANVLQEPGEGAGAMAGGTARKPAPAGLQQVLNNILAKFESIDARLAAIEKALKIDSR
jgi:hypothetical protein